MHSSRRGVCAFLSCPGAVRPGVHIQVVPVLSCIQELQLTDNGLQHHTREQSPIHGRKRRGAMGDLSLKVKEIFSGFFLIN